MRCRKEERRERIKKEDRDLTDIIWGSLKLAVKSPTSQPVAPFLQCYVPTSKNPIILGWIVGKFSQPFEARNP